MCVPAATKVSIDRMRSAKAIGETFLGDAITNIHHYADYHGLEWDEALSDPHYEPEKGTPRDEEAWGLSPIGSRSRCSEGSPTTLFSR